MSRPCAVTAVVAVNDGQFEVEFHGGVAQLVCGDTRIVLDNVAAAASLASAANRANSLLLADRIYPPDPS